MRSLLMNEHYLRVNLVLDQLIIITHSAINVQRCLSTGLAGKRFQCAFVNYHWYFWRLNSTKILVKNAT